MRYVLGLCLLAVACGGTDSDSDSERAEDAVTGSSSQERWCNSYKSEEYCPKNVCVWHEANPAVEDSKAYCGLPSKI